MTAKRRTIIDCYTDEPAGLGVPPFLGTYPRLVAGWFDQTPTYLTIDDVRLASIPVKIKKRTFDPPHTRTRIDLINHTRSQLEVRQLLQQTEVFYIICGIQTPGKYLRALPGTLAEIAQLLAPYPGRKILTGPAARHGTQRLGGQLAEQAGEFDFDRILPIEYNCDYQQYQQWILRGADIVRQIPWPVMAELETGRGCPREPGCSFCTEPLKGSVGWRPAELIEREAAALIERGVTHLRLGKQSCIFSYGAGELARIRDLLSRLRRLGPEVLHIDNVNPAMVTPARTELFCEYLTPGSTAAMGVESFDPQVCARNNLNSDPETTLRAIRIINRFGSGRDDQGRYRLLPGLNILLGLPGETPQTLQTNYEALRDLFRQGALLGRVNIRQVVPFPGTPLFSQAADRVLRQNRYLYSPWSRRIRREIDTPMLQRLYPAGTVLRRLVCETHTGQTTWARQLGSYPIVVNVPGRLPLGQGLDVRVVHHRARSLEAEILEPGGQPDPVGTE